MNLNFVAEKRERIYLFLISFLLITYYLLYVSPHKVFYFDSHDYFWGLSKAFVINGDFNLLNFKEPLRGVMFPLFNFFIIKFSNYIGSDPVDIYKIFSAFYISVLSTIVIPAFISRIIDIKIRFWQIILFCLLMFVFWRGYYVFPLTDFLSLAFLILGLYSWVFPIRYGSIITGAAFAIAINLRPAYLLVFVIFGIWIIVELITKKIYLKETLIKVGFLTIAFMLISIPQLYINKIHFDTYSPLVQTARSYSDGGDLFLQQLRWGVWLEKYETNVGAEYPEASVRFLSKAGISIKEFEYISSYSKYMYSFKSNPLGHFYLYFKHSFNALDIIYPEPYIIKVYDKGRILPLLNYSLIFLFCIIVSTLRVFDLRILFLVLIIISPSLLAIPTAIEVRFFLPIHILIYAFVSFFDAAKLKNYMNAKNLVKYSVLYLIFILTCFVLSYNTYLNLEYPARSIN